MPYDAISLISDATGIERAGFGIRVCVEIDKCRLKQKTET